MDYMLDELGKDLENGWELTLIDCFDSDLVGIRIERGEEQKKFTAKTFPKAMAKAIEWSKNNG